MPKLISINVSLPKEVQHKGKTVTTGIYKEPIEGTVKVHYLNLEGDGQADLIGHGGEMRAVYVYSHDNYQSWANELDRDDFTFGQFGENFTVEAMLDANIHIGDQFEIGTAVFEVSQPRVPCYKLAMKMGVPDFYSRILKSGRLGFYFRVLKEGEVTAGDEIVPVKINSSNGMTISEVNDLMYFDKRNYEGFEKALTFEPLSPGWAHTFKDRLAKRAREEKELKAYKPLKVSKIVEESQTIKSFYLKPVNGSLDSFNAGQFLPIKLDVPGQYEPVYRTYTISNIPEEGYYRLSIKREETPKDIPEAYPGVSSNYFHNLVELGTTIMAAKPRGDFHLKENGLPIVLVSAGVGITPLLSMLQHLTSMKDRRKIYFLHGARNSDEQAFKQLLKDFRKVNKHLRITVAYSKPLADDQLGVDFDVEGRINLDMIKKTLDYQMEAEYYVCGPGRFMYDILSGLRTDGIALEKIHFEIFNSASEQIDLSAFLDRSNESEIDKSFIIEFLSSKQTKSWNSSYNSILEFAESNGIQPDYSCREGVCGTCLTKIESGEVSYKEEPLYPTQEDEILICCSKPKSNLSLKL